MKNLLKLLTLFTIAGFLVTACEGPMGPAGKDANETCKQCHNTGGVDSVFTMYYLSKHSYGETPVSEAGSTGCAPCHTSEGFKYVVANKTPAAFSIAAGTTTYASQYVCSSSTGYGEFSCGTCHPNLHSTYTDADFMPVTTTAGVPMLLNGGTKTIDLTQDGGKSNLCVKCHQPRPLARSFGDKNIIDYAALASSPTTVFFDGTNPNATTNVNTIKPTYRTGTHYGTAGAIYAGKGGVEFGTGYTNSAHTSVASCEDCHMSPITGKTGGHTFFARGNFTGCNVTGCHSANPISASTTSSYWAGTRNQVKSLLDQIGAKLKIGGVELMSRNGNSAENYYIDLDANKDGSVEPVLVGVNLWYGITTNNYDGYLNIYDPASNASGSIYNTTMFQNPSPSTSWTAGQTAYNLTLPKLSLTNAQMGAAINFMLCVRDYSLGIHNTKYTVTLLTNTLAALP